MRSPFVLTVSALVPWLALTACVGPAHQLEQPGALAYLRSEQGTLELIRCGRTRTIGGVALHNIDESFPAGSRAGDLGRSAEVHSAWGMGLTFASLGVLVVGPVVAIAADEPNDGRISDASAGLLIGSVLTSLVLSAVASGQQLSSQTRLLEAVAAYNEEALADPEAACADVPPPAEP